MRREAVIAVGWLAAVVAAAAAGFAGAGGFGDAAAQDPPLSRQDVQAGLAEAGPVGSATPQASLPAAPSPGVGADSRRRYISSPGGTFSASCADGLARLDSVTPSQGFRVDGKQVGPARTVWVKFKMDVERGHGTEYQVIVDCVDGRPRERVELDG